MNPSQLELDRNITTLRINSSELSKMSNQELIVLLNKTIENIQGIAYYWATLSAEKKGILQKYNIELIYPKTSLVYEHLM